MTDITQAGESGLAIPDAGMAMPEGLEDMSAADVGTPRIQIDHDEIAFKDTQSGELYGALENIIVLGLQKQRVLFPAQVDEGKNDPMCKSFDAKTGLAVPATFPWPSTKFDPNSFPKVGEDTDYPRIALPCADCSLTAWDTHPKRESPWCTLQNTVIILNNYDGIWMPALISFQRSALKNCNTYLSTFIRAAKPAFTAYTTITLDRGKRGSNEYGIPKFTKGQATPPENYPYFSQVLREVKDYLTQQLRGDGGDEEMIGVPVAAPTTSAPAPQAASPVATPVAPSGAVGDTPAGDTATTVAPPPAAAPPAQPAPVAAPPAAPPPVPAPPAPVAQSEAPPPQPAVPATPPPTAPPQPPVAAQPAPADPASGGIPDDLPF